MGSSVNAFEKLKTSARKEKNYNFDEMKTSIFDLQEMLVIFAVLLFIAAGVVLTINI